MKPGKIQFTFGLGQLRKYIFLRYCLFAMGAAAEMGDAERIKSTIDEIRGRELKILIVDDDDRFRKSFCFKLKRIYKAQVDDVDRGRKGIERIEAGYKYDLIFTDIMMPQMTGIETYYEIRKIDAQIPIVIMSAYSSSTEWQKALELKDVTLLHKPVPNDELIEVLANA